MSASDISASDVVAPLDGIADVFTTLEQIRIEKAEIAERERELVEYIKSQLGTDATVGTVDGRVVVTHRFSAPAKTIDTKGLKADHPELYEKYLVEKQAARPFKLIEGA